MLDPLAEQTTVDQYNEGVSSKLAYYRLSAKADARSFNALLQIIERYERPPGRILDVGCNIGTFVNVAEARGWTAVGVDLNRDAVNFGRSSNRLRLLTLDQFEEEESELFDVIHTSDTVEHFTHPAGVMRYYAARLKPDGLLAVSTPNYDSRLCKVFQLKPTEHLFLFNAASLEFMLRSMGLDIVAKYPFDRYRNISAMYESTTFDGSPQLKRVFKALHSFAPELLLRLKGGENILVLAKARRVAGWQQSD